MSDIIRAIASAQDRSQFITSAASSGLLHGIDIFSYISKEKFIRLFFKTTLGVKPDELDDLLISVIFRDSAKLKECLSTYEFGQDKRKDLLLWDTSLSHYSNEIMEVLLERSYSDILHETKFSKLDECANENVARIVYGHVRGNKSLLRPGLVRMIARVGMLEECAEVAELLDFEPVKYMAIYCGYHGKTDMIEKIRDCRLYSEYLFLLLVNSHWNILLNELKINQETYVPLLGLTIFGAPHGNIPIDLLKEMCLRAPSRIDFSFMLATSARKGDMDSIRCILQHRKDISMDLLELSENAIEVYSLIKQMLDGRPARSLIVAALRTGDSTLFKMVTEDFGSLALQYRPLSGKSVGLYLESVCKQSPKNEEGFKHAFQTAIKYGNVEVVNRFATERNRKDDELFKYFARDWPDIFNLLEEPLS